MLRIGNLFINLSKSTYLGMIAPKAMMTTGYFSPLHKLYVVTKTDMTEYGIHFFIVTVSYVEKLITLPFV